jgi:hypothetical protein
MKTNELKTDYWKEIRKEQKPINHYDEELDTFFLYFSQKEDDVIVSHFVDEFVAFLYRCSDNQVVGMRIEYFKEVFLPKTAENGEWKLSSTGKELAGLRDLNFRVEVVQITKPIPTPKPRLNTKRPIEKTVELEPVFA